jgi:hypothetical protein
MTVDANERFKRRARRLPWIAGGIAIVAHLAVLLMSPPIEIDFEAMNARPRLVVTLSDWEAPPCTPDCTEGVVIYDTVMQPPNAVNLALLNGRLPRVYPPPLWQVREPSHGVFEITVDESGDVRHARMLESSDNGSDEALTGITPALRFHPSPGSGRVAFTARLSVAVKPPLEIRPPDEPAPIPVPR